MQDGQIEGASSVRRMGSLSHTQQHDHVYVTATSSVTTPGGLVSYDSVRAVNTINSPHY